MFGKINGKGEFGSAQPSLLNICNALNFLAYLHACASCACILFILWLFMHTLCLHWLYALVVHAHAVRGLVLSSARLFVYSIQIIYFYCS